MSRRDADLRERIADGLELLFAAALALFCGSLLGLVGLTISLAMRAAL